MGILSLVFKKTQRTIIQGAALDGNPIVLDIDATVSMNHERAATPTKNPIETGSNVTDHINLDNDRLSIEGVVTNSPLSLIQSAQTILSQRLVDAAVNQFGLNRGLTSGALGSVGRLLINDGNRVENTFRYLEEIHANRIPFSIITGLKRYSNMVLVKLSVPQTSADGDAIRFNATFEKILIVESQLTAVSIENLADDVKHTSKKTINTGKQELNEASKKTSQKASVAFDILENLVTG
tara:strand:+ start:2783 stop:3496 length:714 start_codon:yes stop_codon:yes gene_type:complete